MAGGKRLYYWDSVCLIAWITDEKRDPAETSGLAEVISEVDRGDALIMTSVLWRAEVLTQSMTVAQKKRLEDSFSPKSIIELEINGRITALAGEIRHWHSKQTKKDEPKNIRTPDAIHLASAIHFEATEFHTFDGASKFGKSGGLIRLNGNVGGHILKICVPRATQLQLDLPRPHKP
jgi:predicted nucleic acid-binding protein